VRRVEIRQGPPDEEVIAACVRAMRSGGVVAYPTDTLYGLGVDPASARGVAALFVLKGRAEDQALPLVAASAEQASRVARLTPLAKRLAERFWPGPLTLVLPAARPFAAGVAAADGTVAIRVPDQAIARALALALGGPVTATSANRSGQPPARSADEVIAAFGEAIDVVLDAGPAPGGVPSSIVDASGVAPRLLRAGAVPWERVLESLQ
jgi:L-threonylcarbamoyladenylate synthase